MTKETLYSIDVEVAGRNYPIFVNKEEESVVLELAEQLNTEIQEMHRKYANKLSKTDILAMLLLTYAKKLHDTVNDSNTNKLLGQLDAIHLMLAEALPDK